MTPLAWFIYFISLYSSLSPILQKNAGYFLQLGCQVNPPQALFALPSPLAASIQATKANASPALGQLEVAWGHSLWCSQLLCQHLDAEFILTRIHQAQRNPSLPQKIHKQHTAHTDVGSGMELNYSWVSIFYLWLILTSIHFWSESDVSWGKGCRHNMERPGFNSHQCTSCRCCMTALEYSPPVCFTSSHQTLTSHGKWS